MWAGAQAQTPEVPNAQQLVDGAVAIAQGSSNTVFSLASLLRTLCSHDSGRDRGVVITRLMQYLGGGRPGVGEVVVVEGRSKDSLLAPAHLLAVLVTDDMPAREAAAEQGEMSHGCSRYGP